MSYPYRPMQDGLRAAGHYLDGTGRRLVGLLVMKDGIVVTLRPHDLRGADEAVLLTDNDLQTLYADSRSGRGSGETLQAPDPLCPTGYEDFLRALGTVASHDGWSQVRLVRMGDEAILHYHAAGQRQETVLDAAGVEEMLNQAFRQRGAGTPPSSAPNIWVVPTSPNDERS